MYLLSLYHIGLCLFSEGEWSSSCNNNVVFLITLSLLHCLYGLNVKRYILCLYTYNMQHLCTLITNIYYST